MVKSGSADVQICGCHNRDRAMVTDRVKITVKVRPYYRVSCCDIRFLPKAWPGDFN